MERKGKIFNTLLNLMTMLSVCSCTLEDDMVSPQKVTMDIILQGESYNTRTYSNDIAVHDLNIIIFEDGLTDMMIWTEGDSNIYNDKISVSLLKGHRYTVFAVANLGRRLEVKGRSDLDEEYFELADAEDICNRMPMTAWKEDIVAENGGTVSIRLTRMAAKVSIGMDRSLLNDDVSLTVVGARIGNSPRRASLTGTNKVIDRYGCLDKGFELNEEECLPLNISVNGGLSGEASLYLFENMQGEFPTSISDAEEKVFAEGDPMADICSYLELEMEYRSNDLIGYDSNLIYRFYLGDGISSLDVERNCHYHMTVTPSGDGLSGGGWRVDKSGIGPATPVFAIYPGEILQGHIGDTLRIWCEYYPRSAPFDPGIEELEFDRMRGIYDYIVGENAVTLTLKSPGTGIVYMSAGHPVNQSGMVIITVYP